MFDNSNHSHDRNNNSSSTTTTNNVHNNSTQVFGCLSIRAFQFLGVYRSICLYVSKCKQQEHTQHVSVCLYLYVSRCLCIPRVRVSSDRRLASHPPVNNPPSLLCLLMGGNSFSRLDLYSVDLPSPEKKWGLLMGIRA